MHRKIVFSGWYSGWKKKPFDRLAAAGAVSSIPVEQRVLNHGDSFTAVEVVDLGDEDKPTVFQVLALHDAANRPSTYGPESGARTLTIDDDVYTAFVSFVTLWHDKVAAHDSHANAPGLGRLSIYLHQCAEHSVVFTTLYNQELFDQLEDIAGMRSVELAVYRSHKARMLEESGLLGLLMPRHPTTAFRVKAGLDRSTPKNEFLPEEMTADVYAIAERAGDLLDSLVVTGLSKTERTKRGAPATKRINLLSERLAVESDGIEPDPNAANVPAAPAIMKAMRTARRELDDSGALGRALSARPELGDLRP